MRFLVVTNLYPPQELGGYGRCISDFVWAFQRNHHFVQVVTSDAPYLHTSTNIHSDLGPSQECVNRQLLLKGSYEGGVSLLQDHSRCNDIDLHNNSILSKFLSSSWDCIFLGNIDLLGVQILDTLSEFCIPILHHIGFIASPFALVDLPKISNYHFLPASYAVKDSLYKSGFPVSNSTIIYPGARCELFNTTPDLLSPSLSFSRSLVSSGHALGTAANPIKIGFAGLLMESKGVHLLVDSLIQLHNRGIYLQAMIAGNEFQSGYQDKLQSALALNGLSGLVSFLGHLHRDQLSRFWSLQHIGVFPSIHPEAFGIVGAEIMASGLALITSGVGGAAELLEDGLSGLLFDTNSSASLSKSIYSLIDDPSLLYSIASRGKQRAISLFDVKSSSSRIESILFH